MPQVMIYITPEIDKKILEESKLQNLSKIDILQKIIADHYKEKN